VEPAEGTVVDRLVMGDTVTQQVKLSHCIMYIPAHPAPLDSREGSAKAREPEGTLVSARKQEAPETEGKLGHDPAGSLGASVSCQMTPCRIDVVGRLLVEDLPVI
jgi:hypothetical protein